ncbi:MAG: hypothetical protein KDA88_24125 [Planctomycetaceae bacterium]|nr:hypothetical protein [Planctomycetaceae bacterium]MCB9952146.1 hypothetical protein [Planctomycetaceae bacterium]
MLKFLSEFVVAIAYFIGYLNLAIMANGGVHHHCWPYVVIAASAAVHIVLIGWRCARHHSKSPTKKTDA